ncbi:MULTISPECIES: hypothetical protein [unclassified Pseudonocardia]|uniref:hypothetical protein n=1 Tax=unclassified Pseudonocardia TaxID=2619320 RepID=UPI0001FFE2C9|nr:hypothetical protein [Pseudonocardia sp. Ae707_Ps1]OLM20852.1 hypothetical protein Ae707Ps1_5111 [Pseudonocardia sp. Ae707_Ps1]
MSTPSVVARRRAARARLGGLTRHHPDRVDQLRATRAEFFGLRLEEQIRHALVADPPLTSSDRERLAELLLAGPEMEAAAG